MKKLIAILAVFAIMVPALFAQDAGEWSIGSKGQIGTRVDVTPWELRNTDNENSDQTVPLVGMTSYQDYHHVEGQLDLTYRRGGISTGLQFRQASNDIKGFVDFNNGIGSFKAAADIVQLLGGFSGAGLSGGLDDNGRPANLGRGETFVAWISGDYYSYRDSEGELKYRNASGMWSSRFGRAIQELRGGFRLLDGIIDIRVAAVSDGSYPGLFWVSSDIVGDTYTQMDGSNYLAVNVAPIDGLGVGFILPGIFDIGFTGGSSRGSGGQDAVTTLGGINNVNSSGYAYLNSGAYRRFVQDSLERMTLGIRFASGPFNAAVQYGLRGRPMFYEEGTNNIRDTTFLNSVLYFGAQFDINSNMRAELDARGEFFKSFTLDRDNIDRAQEDVTRTALAFGGRFRYTDGPMQAYLAVFFFNDVWTAGWAEGNDVLYGGGSLASTPNNSRSVEGGVLRFRPFFRYDVVPSHLRLRLDTKLDIPLSEWTLNRYDPWETDVKNTYAEGTDLRGYGNGIRAYSLGYEFIPEIFFNVMGTGATDGVDIGANFTGIAARYRLAGLMYTGDLLNKRSSHPTRNAFDIIFRWSF
jgi:hypothetical protein